MLCCDIFFYEKYDSLPLEVIPVRGGVLFPLPVAERGNNATVPRSKKPEDKHGVPDGLFGNRKRKSPKGKRVAASARGAGAATFAPLRKGRQGR